MSAGSVGILNVGAGDTKLTFDKGNPAECIRAARIVKDMLRRGYALLVEIEQDGVKGFRRAVDFDENTCEYIIADFDPIAAGEADGQEPQHEQTIETESQEQPDGPRKVKARRGRTKRVAADDTRGVAVARTAGG